MYESSSSSYKSTKSLAIDAEPIAIDPYFGLRLGNCDTFLSLDRRMQICESNKFMTISDTLHQVVEAILPPTVRC
jgi:hypothetical protein